MAKNDFKAFAISSGANVLKQDDYVALQALLTGFQAGKASSAQVNKALRQATFISAAVAQFVSDKGDVDVLDDGNLAGFSTNLIAAMNKTSQPLDATLTALAALVGAANKLPYFSGPDVAALTDLTAFARTLLGRSDADGVLGDLGLGRVATSTDIQAGTAKKMVDAAGLKAFLPKRNFGTNDFVRIPDVPGGLIIQWGTVVKSTAEGAHNVIFPTPFPNFSLFAIPVPLNTSANPGIDLFGQIGSMSNSDVNFVFSWVTSSAPADGFKWFAIGF